MTYILIEDGNYSLGEASVLPVAVLPRDKPALLLPIIINKADDADAAGSYLSLRSMQASTGATSSGAIVFIEQVL